MTDGEQARRRAEELAKRAGLQPSTPESVKLAQERLAQAPGASSGPSASICRITSPCKTPSMSITSASRNMSRRTTTGSPTTSTTCMRASRTTSVAVVAGESAWMVGGQPLHLIFGDPVAAEAHHYSLAAIPVGGGVAGVTSDLLRGCLALALAGEDPPLAWILLRDARSLREADQGRRAVIDAATSAELAVTAMLDDLLKNPKKRAKPKKKTPDARSEDRSPGQARFAATAELLRQSRVQTQRRRPRGHTDQLRRVQ